MCIWCDKDPYTGNVTSRACEEEIYSAKVDLKMEEKEIEQLEFIFKIGSLVLHTAKNIIKDKNLLRSEGHFMFENRIFKITVEEVE